MRMRRIVAQRDGNTVRVTIHGQHANSVPMIIVLELRESAQLARDLEYATSKDVDLDRG